MSFFVIPVSTAKRNKYLKSRYLVIVASIMLSSCGGGSGGGGGNTSPQPGGETPTETSAAVWGESNWDQVNWQ